MKEIKEMVENFVGESAFVVKKLTQTANLAAKAERPDLARKNMQAAAAVIAMVQPAMQLLEDLDDE